MATIQSPYRSGGLFGFRYIFEKVGDGLRRHAHNAEAAHNIIVLFGSVSVHVEKDPATILLQGSVYDFDWTKEHCVAALEPNTMVLNLNLFGMPTSYEGLPSSDFNSVFDVNG